MNKKFSTLMALALLAGSLPVAAESTTKWIQVKPNQLVNGVTYVIHGVKDSVLINGTGSDPFASAKAPQFVPTASNDTLWLLSTTEKGFTLNVTNDEGVKGNIMYGYSDNGIYTNGNDTEANRAAYFTLSDGILSATVGSGEVVSYVQSYQGNLKLVSEKELATQVSFFMKQEIPSGVTENDIVANKPSTATTMYVIVGGKYVTLDANGNDVSAVDEPGTKNASVWVYDGDKLRSYADNKYLKIVDQSSRAVDLSDDLQLTVTDKTEEAATVSISGQVVSFDGKIATTAVLATANEPVPYNGFLNPAYEGSSVVLCNDGFAYSAVEKNFISYDSENALATVWTLKEVKKADGTYEVRLANSKYDADYLKAGNEWVVVEGVTYNSTNKKFEFPADGKTLLMAGSNYVCVDANGELDVTSNMYEAKEFGLGQIETAHISASELTSRYGDHFTLKITYKDDYDNDVDMTGVFSGNLRPCVVFYSAQEGAKYNYDVEGDSYMLVNEEGKIIAIDLNDPILEGDGKYGYKLVPITPKQYQLDQTDDKTNYAVWFKMEYTPGQAEGDVKVINKIAIDNDRDASPHYRYVIGLLKENGDIKLAAADESLLLDVDDYPISIALNAGSVVDATKWLTKPVYYTVKSINKEGYGRFAGKVLGLNEYGNSVGFVAAENIDLTQPEGQFAIQYDKTNAQYIFINREKDVYSPYTLEEDRLYQIDATTFAYVHGNSVNTPDTLSIEPVSNYSSEDGFKRFSPAELNANTYTVSMKLVNGDLLNIIEKHNDKHRLGLDEDNATEWRIEMPTVKLLDSTDDFLRYAADTVSNVTEIRFFADGDWQTTQITDPKKKYYYPNTELQICTYILKNADNGEYLYGKNSSESVGNSYYVCEPENEDKVQFATRIAFKENGEGTYNLVPVGNWISGQEETEPYNFNGQLSGYKIQGGASGDVLKVAALYEAPANDLFVVNVAEAPTYKKMEQGDKIILSLKNNTENVLVEGPIGGFATISNREAHKDLNPTLYVDTAYVNRAGNYAYQYLLGVRINRVDTTYECNVPAHGTHRADTTFGYFLVNMIDSAKACTDVHNNKFEYNGEHKLDFVKGYRTNDTLFFTNDADEVISSMKIGDASYNMAKFAFKMIDEEANEFVIETGDGYDKQVIEKDGKETTVTNVVTTPSYLRWVNGNLVVTSNIDEAAHFTMEASDKEATANEAISAGNVVVAGTNGAVVVKGAEGKNVIVSTILGKVVANEVVSSDNAQISAPAGIVVVSVDGESFKVVVK